MFTHLGIDTTNITSAPRAPRCSLKDFDKAVKHITNSTFPDIVKLKNMIIDAGYVPQSLRGAVWSLLLTGSISEDEEIKTYRPSKPCSCYSLTYSLTHSLIPTGEFALNNQHKILSDCDAIVTRYKSKSSCYNVVTDMYVVHTQLHLIH